MSDRKNSKQQLALSENRQFNSNVFSMLMQQKKYALSVYNALNNSHYENPDDMEIYMLDTGIFLSIRNDASFLLADTLNVYEHQSTYNPNMPLRHLLYVVNLIAGFIRDKNIFGKTLVKIPTPHFVTFYNGETPRPERETMRLSDAFEIHQEHPELELECTILNINPGYNVDFMEQCPVLHEYMIFVNKVRTYRKTVPLKKALVWAIDECIEEHVLEDFLRKQRAEVMSMTLLEYRVEDQIRFAREEGLSEGLSEGIDQGRKLTILSKICLKLQKNKSPQVIASELEIEPSVAEYICNIARDYAPEYDFEKMYQNMDAEILEML